MRIINRISFNEDKYEIGDIKEGKPVTEIQNVIGAYEYDYGFAFCVCSNEEDIIMVHDDEICTIIAEYFEDGEEYIPVGRTDEIISNYNRMEAFNNKYSIGQVVNDLTIAYIQKIVDGSYGMSHYQCLDINENIIVQISITEDVIVE